MKKYLLLIFISILFIAKADAQIYWGLSSSLNDSCDFTSNCSFIKIDTTSGNIWQIGNSSKLFFSNSRGIMTDTINHYPKNNHSIFEVKLPFDFQSNILSITH
jgi:hypothetical protein